jgi:hypothetical protein
MGHIYYVAMIEAMDKAKTFLFKRVNASWIFRVRIVHDLTNTIRLHLLGLIRVPRPSEIDRIIQARIKPVRIRLFRKNHGHPVMDGGHESIGNGRNQGTRF